MDVRYALARSDHNKTELSGEKIIILQNTLKQSETGGG